MRRALLLAGFGCLLAFPAFAQTVVPQGQIHLAVSDCGGIAVVTNTCASNNGSIVLVGSIVPPVAIPDLIGIEAFIVVGQAGVLSDWWRLDPAGCRAGDLTANFDFTAGPFSCTDLWQGKATGSVGVAHPYAPPPVPPGSPAAPPLPPLQGELIDISCAVPADAPLSITTDQEYYLFSITISKAQTVGAGACPGCNAPTVLQLYADHLVRTPGAGDYWVFGDGAGQGVGYNGGGGCTANCDPVRKSTWGLVKTLYR